MTIELPDDLIAAERAAWKELQAGKLTVATAEAAQAAVTAHATATGLSRYTVEMAVKKAVRHAEAEG